MTSRADQGTNRSRNESTARPERANGTRPYQRRTQQERLQMVRLVQDVGLSQNQAALKLHMPKSTGKAIYKKYKDSKKAKKDTPLHISQNPQNSLQNEATNRQFHGEQEEAHEETLPQTSMLGYFFPSMNWPVFYSGFYPSYPL